MCHVSCVTCQVSHVTCHLSPVTCHMSDSFIFIFILFLQSGEASEGRDCYQRGLPRLVFLEMAPLSQTVADVRELGDGGGAGHGHIPVSAGDGFPC